MKRISRLLVTLVFSLCIVLSCTSAVSAAGLAKVTGLKVSSYSVSSVKLAWTAVKSAKKYQIQVFEGNNKKATKTLTTSDSKTTYTVTGLKAKTSYKFAVRAYNSGFINGAYSSTVSAKTGVAKVTNFKASVSATTAKLTWNNVAGATGYVLQQKKGDSWKTIAKPTKNTYTVKNLTPNKKVYFRIYAFTKSGSKTYKGETVKLTVTPKVPAVSSLKATTSNCSTLKLTWAKTSGATGYILQQQNGKKWKTVAKPTKNTYTVKSLTPNKKVTFRVCAYTKVGKKTYMGAYTTLTAKPTVTAVSTFTSSTSYASATLKWSAAAGAKGYQIQYATKSDFKGAKTVTIKDSKTLSYKLSSLNTGTTYYLRIRAYQTAKVSGKTKTYNSSWKTLTIKPVLSGASGLGYSSVSTSSSALSWKKVSGASGYQIVYATSSNFKSNKKTAWVKSGSTVTASISKLASGTQYFVKVRPYRTVGDSKVYGSYSNTVNFVTAPAQVSGLKAVSVADKSIKVQWNATTAAKYIVYYKAASSKSYSSAEATANSYTLSGLSSATTYNFYVIAVNSAGTKGKASSAISATTLGVSSAAPTLSISSLTANGAKASWNKVAGATGYQLQYATKSTFKDAKTVTVKGGDTLSATVSGLAVYEDYYYRVRAYGTNGSSTVYGTYSATKAARTLHTKVTGLKATGSDYTVTLSWDKLSYTKYNVYYKLASASSYSKIESTTNSYTLTNLDGSKDYNVYVRAVGKDGSEGEKSAVATAKTSGLSKDKPTAKLTYSDKTPTKATVTWTAVPGATGYRVYCGYKTNAESKLTSVTVEGKTSYTYTGLQSGTEFTVYVKAYLDGATYKEGTASNSLSFVTKPAAVENLQAVPGEDSISLSWNPTPCYAYYVTYTPAGGKATTVKTQSNKYVLSGLTAGKSYAVSVAAANSKDVKGSEANITKATCKGINSVTVQDGIISININAVANATNYRIQQYSVARNTWDFVADTILPQENGTVTLTSSDWKNVNTALVRVVALDADNNNIFVSDPYEKTVTTGSDFEATANASNYSVTLKWKDDVAAASTVRVYNIYGNSYSEVTAKADDTFTYYVAPGAIHRFAVYSDGSLVYSAAVEMPAIDTSLTSNEARNAQVNYLVQAINNTKNDTTDYTFKAVSGGDLLYDTTYLRMEVDSTNAAYKTAFVTALALSGVTDGLSATITCNNKEEIDEKMGAVLGDDLDGSFSNVRETFDITSSTYQNGSLYKNGMLNTSIKATSSVEPFGKDASWQHSQVPANWKNAFSSISTTKQSDGTYKVVAVLNRETTSTDFHSAFLSKDTLDGSSSIDMSDVFGEGSDGNVNVKSIGATTLTAVIDSNNHLVSYSVKLPSIIDMDMVVDLPIDNEDSIIIDLDMTLDCTTNYEYTFIEM